MKHRFFLHGTCLGLFAGIPLVSYLVGGKEIFRLLLVPSFGIPIAAGFLSALSLARAIDSASPPPGLGRAIGLLELVFLGGTLAGCLGNWLLNGRVLRPPYGWEEEFWVWFVKPAFWLLGVGIPCAAVVAAAAYVLSRLLGRGRFAR